MFRGSKSLNKLFKCETFFGTYGIFRRETERRRNEKGFTCLTTCPNYIHTSTWVKIGNDWCRVGWHARGKGKAKFVMSRAEDGNTPTSLYLQSLTPCLPSALYWVFSLRSSRHPPASLTHTHSHPAIHPPGHTLPLSLSSRNRAL